MELKRLSIGTRHIMRVKTKKKICVVGAGRWGRNHIRTLSSLDCLTGIVDNDRSKLNSIDINLDKVNLYSSLEDALEFPYDGFIIATPSETHYSLGMKIIDHGAPVLIEKPLCLSPKEARDIVAFAEQRGVNLLVGHVLLFHPAINKIKKIIKSNKIGKLQYIYSNRLNLGTVRTTENVFWSFAPHDISVFNFLIESPIESVQSFGSDIIQKGIHDSTITSVKYKNGVSSHIFVSWLHPFKEHRIVVIGSEGMLLYEDSSKDKDIIHYKKGIKFMDGIPSKEDGDIEVIEYNFSLPLTNELSYFIDNLDTGFNISNGESAIQVIDILDSASQKLGAFID